MDNHSMTVATMVWHGSPMYIQKNVCNMYNKLASLCRAFNLSSLLWFLLTILSISRVAREFNDCAEYLSGVD